ncbi:MAG TPA: N-acetylglucosamine-6-phosphate deacetylase [Verrucomicrobiae bacterium]|nr:N-acetylglucosamine-6-phosphate deacetylase [Verrucomicrobiae bacterium]
MKTTITAGRLLTPLECIESPVVVIEDGHVLSVHSAQQAEVPRNTNRFDFPDKVLAPGLIDVHVHGNAGHDVMETDASALASIQRAMAKHGVTSYLPTTVTAPQDQLLRALEHLAKAISRRDQQEGSRPLGIHLEGPFISHAKGGVHPRESLVQPSVEMFDRFWQASGGTLRMMTIAPELPGAIETIAHARRSGVHSSLGHSNATYKEANRGIASGAEHATHTFNAMRPLDHREPGILGAVLSDDRLTADIIADGVHLDPSIVKLFLAAKGAERAILITDAISATGMGDGRYRLGAFEVEVKGDRCEYQGRLAGSVLTLDRALRNTMNFGGWNLQQALRLATLNPAHLLGISPQKGTITPGCDADLVVLTPGGDVVQTFIAGRPCL